MSCRPQPYPRAALRSETSRSHRYRRWAAGFVAVLALAALAAPVRAQPAPPAALSLAAGPVVPLDPDQVSTASPALEATPDGFLAAWERQRPEQPHIVPPSPAGEAIAFRELAADGSPAGPPVEVQRVPSPDVVTEPRISRDGDGHVLVAWRARREDGSQTIDWAAPGTAPVVGDAAMEPRAEFQLLGEPSGHSLVFEHVDATATSLPPAFHYEFYPEVLALAADGDPEGPPTRLAGEASTRAGAGSASVGAGILASWLQAPEEAESVSVQGVFRGPAGTSDPFEIFAEPIPSPATQLSAPLVAPIGGGTAVVAWLHPLSHAFLIRRAGPAGPIGEEIRLDAPENVFLSAPALATGPGGVFALAWRQFDAGTEEASCRLAVFDPLGRPLTDEVVFEPGNCFGPAVAWSGSSLAVAWSVNTTGRLTEARSQVFQVQGAAPPVPDRPAVTDADFPGFRFWVRISAGGTVIEGTEVGPCIPEAVCFAGALPDRPEVIVRIVGPKPNGFLWPTLVKLSTSRVEVWIEQESTGLVRYYELEGASPGFDVLPGLFDRHGFEP